MGEYKGKNTFTVEVKPGESKIFILKRLERNASYKVSYFSSVILPDEKMEQLVKANGKKQQVKH